MMKYITQLIMVIQARISRLSERIDFSVPLRNKDASREIG